MEKGKGIFDEFVENTIDHTVNTLSNPETYTGSDDNEDEDDDV